MTEYRRTSTITDIEWDRVFRAYEARFDVTIDPAVNQMERFYQDNWKTWDRRLGACTVYSNKGGIFGEEKFRDEILSELGIHLGYEEVPE